MIARLFKAFSRRSLRDTAQAELAAAQFSLLEALSAAEYADAVAVYHQARIDRLEALLNPAPMLKGSAAVHPSDVS